MPDADRLKLLEEFTAAWTAKDVDALMGLMAEDCAFRASVGPEPGASFVGRDAVRRGYEQFLAAGSGPPPESENDEPLVTGDFAVTRWTLRWPQADGAPVEVRGCDVFEFEGGRIKLKDTYRKVADQPPVAAD
jgi:ketosteroid isomerase-like protein